jgi:DNA-binding LacI/PurR family transcriptional regulator
MKAKKTHQYLRVMGDLEKKIRDGKWKEGDYIPAANEVCKLYSVSQITAGRALDELEHMGYIKRERAKGSRLVSRVATAARESVCMVMTPEAHLFAPLAERIIAGLQRLNYQVNTQTIGTVLENPEAASRFPSNAKALIIEGDSIKEAEFVRNTMRGIEFCVFVIPDGLGDERFSASVECDVFHAGYIAARHCADCGYKRLVFFTYHFEPDALWAASYRRHCEGVQAACQEKKVEFLLRDVADRRDEQCSKVIAQMLAQTGKGCAVLSNMDFLVAQVHRVAQEMGWRVPEDLGLVGYCNTPWSVALGLTTIDVQIDIVADHTIKVVNERRQGKIIVPPTLVVRGSTCSDPNRGAG